MSKKKLQDIKLTLFFSEGTSLKVWDDVGNLNREVALYKKLQQYLNKINFITYGNIRDYTFKDQLKGINICPSYWLNRPFRLSKWYFLLNLAMLVMKNREIFQESDIFKTNQVSGSQIPVLLKKLYKKKLLLRCGNLPGRFAEIADTHPAGIKRPNSVKTTLSIEKHAFDNADLAIVPTEEDRQWTVEKHKLNSDKIRVIPNYVEIERFIQMPNIDKKYDLVTVAKDSPQKNIENLIKALYRLKEKGIFISILFIGKCGKSEVIRKELALKRLNISVAGNIDSKDLPLKFSEARVFILPSYYEGSPKALLEAMSSAMPVIAADAPGINNIVSHRKNGYLCKTDSGSISDAISKVLNDIKLQKTMGENARKLIKNNYSLDRVLKMELEVIKELEELKS